MYKFGFPAFIFLSVLWLQGCFSEQKEKGRSEAFAVAPAYHDQQLPEARSPEEAVMQLMEGNSRYVHGELRMQEAAAKEENKPMAAVLVVCPMTPYPGMLFDQPRGLLYIVPWGTREELAAGLDGAIASGVKALVVLGHEECGHRENRAAINGQLPKEGGRWFPFILKQALVASPALSAAVRNGKCGLIGAGYDQATRRIQFLGQEAYR